jgi:hypothetical protein
MRHVQGVKISGCISYIYSWMEIIIDSVRTLGYSVYTKHYIVTLKVIIFFAFYEKPPLLLPKLFL